MGQFHIAVLGGDGIGPEVTAEQCACCAPWAERFGHTFDLTEALCGARAPVEQEGAASSEETMALCAAQRWHSLWRGWCHRQPSNPNRPNSLKTPFFRLRKECELFANLRPVKPRPGLLDASTIRARRAARALTSWWCAN